MTWRPSGRRSEQLADDLGHVRGSIVGREFHERDYDKIAFFHPRVRNFQAGLADPFVPVHKNIQIQRTRPIADPRRAIAPEFLLDPQQLQKKRVRIKFGPQCDNGIEKPGLVCEPYGFGGVERGAANDRSKGFEPDRGGGEG